DKDDNPDEEKSKTKDSEEKKDDDDDDEEVVPDEPPIDPQLLVDTKLIAELDTKTSQQALLEEQKAAGHDHDGLFTRFQPDFQITESKEEGLCGRKNAVALWQREFGLQFYVHCKNLVFGLG